MGRGEGWDGNVGERVQTMQRREREGGRQSLREEADEGEAVGDDAKFASGGGHWWTRAVGRDGKRWRRLRGYLKLR